ncbi:MAG: DNA polymerase-3 subunit epsilon, partial [Paracoccaceae bacterium]
PRVVPLPDRISSSERAAHKTFVEKLGDGAVWRKFDLG